MNDYSAQKYLTNTNINEQELLYNEDNDNKILYELFEHKELVVTDRIYGLNIFMYIVEKFLICYNDIMNNKLNDAIDIKLEFIGLLERIIIKNNNDIIFPMEYIYCLYIYDQIDEPTLDLFYYKRIDFLLNNFAFNTHIDVLQNQ